jgi:hypothetical protein
VKLQSQTENRVPQMAKLPATQCISAMRNCLKAHQFFRKTKMDYDGGVRQWCKPLQYQVSENMKGIVYHFRITNSAEDQMF